MLKISPLFMIIFCLLTLVPASAQEATPDADFDARTYELFVPESYDAYTPTPLVMVLHGASGTGARTQGWLGFDKLAEDENFIVVYPDGLYNNWDFGAGVLTPDGVIEVDDVGYLTSVVDELSAEYNIDPEQVFVTGMSNGAVMAYRLGCEAPDTFKAVAGVAAGIFTMAVQNCNQSIPVLFIQGSADVIIPWDGTLFEGQYVGLSAADSLSFWAQMNECSTKTDAVIQTDIPDTDTEDSSVVKQISMTDCADDTQVQFYAVVGGGHTWPGHPFDVDMELGALNMDIDATQVIWDWFKGSAELKVQSSE